jgi:hypothetical protein
LRNFQKFHSIPQNQVQSISFDVSKGLGSSKTIKYIKRIELEQSGSIPEFPEHPKHGVMYWATHHSEQQLA